MEIIRKENTKPVMPIKRGRDTRLRGMLLQLEVGDELFMKKEEWKRKNGPYYVIARIKKTHGWLFKYGEKTDGTGWQFKRVK